MIRAAVYIRKSREDKTKPGYRLSLQRRQLPAHAGSQGWHAAIYDDGHASAARGKIEDFKERSRLKADIRANKIDIVVVIGLSRLSRDDSLQDYVAWLFYQALRKDPETGESIKCAWEPVMDASQAERIINRSHRQDIAGRRKREGQDPAPGPGCCIAVIAAARPTPGTTAMPGKTTPCVNIMAARPKKPKIFARNRA